jgi:hypothetical protein
MIKLEGAIPKVFPYGLYVPQLIVHVHFIMYHSQFYSFDYPDPQFRWEYYLPQVMSLAVLSLLHSVSI